MTQIKRYPPKKIGWFTWETVVETPTCSWYFQGWTKRGSQRAAMEQFKELVKDDTGTETGHS